MDRALDEIVAERHRGESSGRRPRERRGFGVRRNDRSEYPRDGVKKVHTPPQSSCMIVHFSNLLNASRNRIHRARYLELVRDDNRNIDSEWVHDKFDDNSGRRPIRIERRYSPDPVYNEPASAKLRVENLHYDLTEDDLDDLFNRIGPVLKLSLTYDRAGRSEGIAYVTYESYHDAKKAIREFDGANAKGQPIRLISIPAGLSGGRRNVAPQGRSLFERITPVPGRSRSDSPVRHSNVSGPPPNNVDRYVPGSGSRSRSPRPRGGRGRDGRRPGARRERGERNGGAGRGERLAKDGRPKKTQEELDAEMEDYWGGKDNGAEGAAGSAPAAKEDDVDMIE